MGVSPKFLDYPQNESMRRRSLLLGALALAGCAHFPGLGEQPDDNAGVRDAATRAAQALRAGEDAADAFSSAAPIEVIYSGMDGLRPEVTVGESLVDERGERGSVQLGYRWRIRVEQPDWTYTTPLTLLRKPGGDWLAEWSPRVVNLDLEEGDWLSVRSVPAQRGEILGADEERLVYRHAVVRVGLDLANVDRDMALESAPRLANELAIDPGRYLERVESAGARAFVEAQVLRIEDPAHRSAIAGVEKIPGVRLINDERMLAVDPTFARPLLGIVGEATAEVIERSGGEVRPGDVVGLSGFQALRDQDLRGVPGYVVESRPNRGVLARAEPKRGRPITVSLDLERQLRAESRVARFGDPCAVVLLRIADGHILAAASGRGGQGFSTATLAQVPVPAPEGGETTAAALGWGTAPAIGTPAFLGELSGTQAVVSPLGVAVAAASAASEEVVSPVFEVKGTPPARPAFAVSDRTVSAWLDEVSNQPEWWLEVAEGLVAVGYVEGGDAATLMSGWITA